MRVVAGANVTFQDWLGDCGGDAFEDDAFDLVDWVLSAQTELDDFEAEPGPELVTLEWTTVSEAPVDRFLVEWAPAAQGPFTLLAELPPAESGSYGLLHELLEPDHTCYYRLLERLVDGTLNGLAFDQATPWDAGTPENVLDVGPDATYPDVQSAIDAATRPDTVVRVAPGVFDAFSVGAAAPAGLRVVGSGADLTWIDTSQGPVRIEGRSAEQSVELASLEIGDSLSEHPAVSVLGSDGTVLLDEVTLHGGVGQPGLRAEASSAIAVQRCDIDGAPGILATDGSRLIASRGTLESLGLQGLSTATLVQLNAAAEVELGSTLSEPTGLMPNVDVSRWPALGESLDFELELAPGAVWLLGAAPRLSWTNLPEAVPGTPVLLELSAILIAGSGTADEVTGMAHYALTVPPVGALLGERFAWQVVQLDGLSGGVRLSNAVSSTLLPK